jgi:FMN reductase [NAD(P)H]
LSAAQQSLQQLRPDADPGTDLAGRDMSADYEALLRARFGTSVDTAFADIPDLPELRRVLARRTHRTYTDQEVSPDLIRLLSVGAHSASAKSDFQQASIITVTDPERRTAIAKPFPAMPWIGTAPAFLVFCGDTRRLERLGVERGHPATNRNLEGFFNATVDATLAMQTFILLAESAGLGVCPISVLRNEVDTVAPVLGLPEGVFPVAGLCVGWPAAEGYVSLRLPPSVTLHTNTYDDTAMPDAIDRYDHERDARHATPRDKQRAPAIFGYADFYGWSEDKSRQSAQGEGAAFPPWLRKNGFTFD